MNKVKESKQHLYNYMVDFCKPDHICAFVFIHRVKKIVGYNAEDMIGQQIISFIHPSDLNNNIERCKYHKKCI